MKKMIKYRVFLILVLCLFATGCIQQQVIINPTPSPTPSSSPWIASPTPIPTYTPVTPPDIHFSNIEAFTNGQLRATIMGSGSVLISRLRWVITVELTDYSKFLVNGIPANSNTMIKAGDRITIIAGENWSPGQEIRLTIADKASGQLLADVTVRAKSL
ncbi:MAG: hypothetical protein QXQ02_03535 [Halobacteria archaeon]